MMLDAGDESPYGSIGASIDEQYNKKADRKCVMDEKEIAEIITHMHLEIKFNCIIVSFDEDILKGLTIRFWGAPENHELGGIVIKLSGSGKVIAPVKRELTYEENEYVKASVLAYIKARNIKNPKIAFYPVVRRK